MNPQVIEDKEEKVGEELTQIDMDRRTCTAHVLQEKGKERAKTKTEVTEVAPF